MEENKRRFHRLAAQVDCKVCCNDDLTIEGTVRDVSLSGVFVCCDDPPPVETECQVVFTDAEFVRPITGAVTRVEPTGMAVEFVQVPDENCTHFLENLILSAES